MLSVKEAAKRLGRSERMVVYLLNAGKLQGRREGRRWLVEELSVAPPPRQPELPQSSPAVEEPAQLDTVTESEKPELADVTG